MGADDTKSNLHLPKPDVTISSLESIWVQIKLRKDESLRSGDLAKHMGQYELVLLWARVDNKRTRTKRLPFEPKFGTSCLDTLPEELQFDNFGLDNLV